MSARFGHDVTESNKTASTMYNGAHANNIPQSLNQECLHIQMNQASLKPRYFAFSAHQCRSSASAPKSDSVQPSQTSYLPSSELSSLSKPCLLTTLPWIWT